MRLGGLAGRARFARRAGLADLAPVHKAVRRPRPALGSIAGLVVDDIPLEVCVEESPRGGDPVLELGGPGLKVALWNAAERLCVARAQCIEDSPVELLVDDEVAHAARAEHGNAPIVRP